MASKTTVGRMGSSDKGSSKSFIGNSRAFSEGFNASRSQKNISSYASGLTAGVAQGISGARIMLDGKNVTPQSLLRKEKQIVVLEGNTAAEIPNDEKPTITDLSTRQIQSSASLMPTRLRGKVGERKNLATEKVLYAPVTVILEETPTIMLIEIRGTAMALDSREYDKTERIKLEYDQKKILKQGAEALPEKHTQTLCWAQKHKDVTVAPPPTKEVSITASSWDIYDEIKSKSMLAINELENGMMDSDKNVIRNVSNRTNSGSLEELPPQIFDTLELTLASIGCLLDTENTVLPPPIPQNSLNENGSRVGFGGSSSYRISGTSSSKHGKSKLEASKSMLSKGHTSQLNGSSVILSKKSSRIGLESSDRLPLTGSINFSEEEDNPEAAMALILQRRAEKILKSDELLAALELVYRTLQQDTFIDKQLQYCNLPASDSQTSSEKALTLSSMISKTDSTATNKSSAGGLSLKMLWTHNFPKSLLPSGSIEETDSWSYTVSAMCFQKFNQELLAAGYRYTPKGVNLDTCSVKNPPIWSSQSSVRYSTPWQCKHGYVLFWSMRNPGWPEQIIKVPSGVTSLAFSDHHPNYVAVGMLDGTIAVYDITQKCSNIDKFATSLVDSSANTFKHTEPVWQIKWVNKGTERGDTLVLVSISSDGRVCEWSVKKGCIHTPLMLIRRMGATEGVISRQAGGLTFDFPLGETNHYLIGTEDGLIHKCSISYAEQYLETYSAHDGPVYQIKFSPFDERTFLSCSADWTVKVWNEGYNKCIYSLRSLDTYCAINDACWSPKRNKLLASVADNGRLELWDLNHSVLDPALSIVVGRNMDSSKVEQKTGRVLDQSVITSLEGQGSNCSEFGESQDDPSQDVQSTRFHSTISRNTSTGHTVSSNACTIRSIPNSMEGIPLSCVTFSSQNEVISVGDASGRITLFILTGLSG